MLFRRLLDDSEREHLVALATGSFERSEVVSRKKVDDERTSFGAWLNGRRRDEKVLEIQHRLHSLVGIPEEFGESIYMLRYGDGQQYHQHYDHCWADHRAPPPDEACREFLTRAGGPGCGPGAGGATCGDRLATVILFLSSPIAGGATIFPQAAAQQLGAGEQGAAAGRRVLKPAAGGGGEGTAAAADEPWYCRPGAGALSVQAQPGDVLLFWDYVPGRKGAGGLARADGASIHGGCPVLQGTKLIATRWIRSAEFH